MQEVPLAISLEGQCWALTAVLSTAIALWVSCPLLTRDVYFAYLWGELWRPGSSVLQPEALKSL